MIPYFHLGEDQIRKIVDLKLDKIKKRFLENNNAKLNFDPALIEAVTSRCTEVESGARNIDTILTHNVLPELSEKILVKMAEGKEFEQVNVALDKKGHFTYEVR